MTTTSLWTLSNITYSALIIISHWTICSSQLALITLSDSATNNWTFSVNQNGLSVCVCVCVCVSTRGLHRCIYNVTSTNKGHTAKEKQRASRWRRTASVTGSVARQPTASNLTSLATAMYCTTHMTWHDMNNNIGFFSTIRLKTQTFPQFPVLC